MTRTHSTHTSTGPRIRFHGVRGSMATPGTATAQVGGNTSCVEVVYKDTRLILDAGTGLRGLGDELLASGELEATILLSHLHWDHIQGLPFFTPLYMPQSHIQILSGPNGVMPLESALRQQMRAPFFPVAYDDVQSRVAARDLAANETFTVGDATITVSRLNHPDPVYGYRIEVGGASIVYATDTEHFSCVDPGLVKLARGADMLIYDAQYTPEEYAGTAGPARVGWGHSTYAAAVDLARAAEVENLVLFHHDPKRADADVDAIEQRTRAMFANSVAAREGMTLTTADLAAGSGCWRPAA